jgi:hypothetical protein
LNDRELLLVGATLHWAEGSKDKPYRRCESVKFINSDPSVIRVFMAWLAASGVPKSDCGFRVHIHETANAAAAVGYWSRIVEVDPALFRKTTVKRHNPKTNRRNRFELYNGCLVVEVRQSRVLYQRIDGWWRGIVAGASSGE